MRRERANDPMQAPAPAVMPIDREAWARQLNLSNFVNTYYQYNDLVSCGDVRNVLIVGPGQGLEKQVLAARGYRITTVDIDDTFRPDHIGSVHDLGMFATQQFDAVIASHVLEHIAVPYLDRALQEIARVGGYALIYLPVAGRHFHLRAMPGVLNIDVSFIIDVFNWFHRPDGVSPRYCGGQHFWEIGMRGFRVRDLVKRFSRFFELHKAYRNRDWTPSHNFVLRSRQAGGEEPARPDPA